MGLGKTVQVGLSGLWLPSGRRHGAREDSASRFVRALPNGPSITILESSQFVALSKHQSYYYENENI